MTLQPIHIECGFAEEGDIEQILHHSFKLYLDRMLTEDTDAVYTRCDERPCVWGGVL